MIDLEKVNRITYYYNMLVLKLFIILLLLLFVPIVIGSILFNYFPKGKITDWFRRHIITDEDLENP